MRRISVRLPVVRLLAAIRDWVSQNPLECTQNAGFRTFHPPDLRESTNQNLVGCCEICQPGDISDTHTYTGLFISETLAAGNGRLLSLLH
jgi:hypothetical protein